MARGRRACAAVVSYGVRPRTGPVPPSRPPPTPHRSPPSAARRTTTPTRDPIVPFGAPHPSFCYLYYPSSQNTYPINVPIIAAGLASRNCFVFTSPAVECAKVSEFELLHPFVRARRRHRLKADDDRTRSTEAEVDTSSSVLQILIGNN
ncbi:hypothetical protein EVAR_9705_1 [Eumeta japonica]|uniref:Uncharacterized protein n=1 Tax=Eumeta variegata TaxID=151549 RepID=A0A4C1Z028_EUMVA|nr:hypothetical protein EVAR_9705_1 [Eumeta japonica]